MSSSSPCHLMALYLCVLILVVGSLPTSFARPVSCKHGSNCLTPWDEADYNEYVARYNPFNGTHAAILYTDKEAKAMLKILSSNNASQIDDPALLNPHYGQRGLWNCISNAAKQIVSGGGCMYDSTARVRQFYASLNLQLGS